MPFLARSRPLLAGLRTARYGVAASGQWVASPALSLAARQASSLTETSSLDKPEVPHAPAGCPSFTAISVTQLAVAMAGNLAFKLANHSLGYPLDPAGGPFGVEYFASLSSGAMASFCFGQELVQYIYPPPAPSAEPYDMTRLERVKPSVVSVSAFHNYMIGDATAAAAKGAYAQVRGSGLIWDHHGHVVTNFDIGKGDLKLLVQLDSGDHYWTTLVGTDEANNLAVLKLLAPPAAIAALQPARLDTSSSASYGGTAVAIGYSNDHDNTLTKGVITCTADIRRADPSRWILSSPKVASLALLALEHNAAVGAGANGGPLLNERGAYIGINTGAKQRTLGDWLCTFLGDYNPLTSARRAYALPIDKAQESVAHMLRPKLGVVTAGEPSGLNLEGLTGCYVAEVNPNASPLQLSYNLRSTTWGDEGRLFPGDCILTLAGRAVESPSDLRSALDGRSVGDSIAITVRRDNQDLTLTARLGEGGAEGKVAMKWD